jgi:D-alanyl-D-alanine carboxypeptidase/D-alanyl-D-alanine-endopeptidase (penicillin-binding protein 4)
MLSLLAFGTLQGLGEPLNDPKLRGAMICAMVTSMDGKVVFERNVDQRVMPASNEKLFTCAFALAQRGPAYQSKIQFWFDRASVKIVADGDPELTSEQILDLKTRYHIGSAHRVYLKQAYRCDRPDTWQLGDAPNRFAPATHAFLIDKGGFELRGSTKGLSFFPHTPVLTKVTLNPSSHPIAVHYDPSAGTIEVSGKLTAAEQKIDTLSDPDPSLTAISCLTGTRSPILEEMDEDPTNPPTETILSPPFSELIKDCLQPSDNCIAENLLMMGSNAKTYPEARRAITTWLRQVVGLEDTYFRCEDGSGLSRKNQTTVRSISRLLHWTTQQPTAQLWQDSLAKSGVGTLASRLGSVDFVGKTGSLDMVSSLSGFVKCKDGETRIVSVILNHYGCSETEARNIIDRFIENVSK